MSDAGNSSDNQVCWSTMGTNTSFKPGETEWHGVSDTPKATTDFIMINDMLQDDYEQNQIYIQIYSDIYTATGDQCCKRQSKPTFRILSLNLSSSFWL